MQKITVDFRATQGKIKPMNAVNNGPAGSPVRGIKGNFALYEAARIPYARNHDASFYAGYGGEHTVDVHRIFRDFDADETLPENYIFGPTDQYTSNTFAAGTKIFYRLGASIEHGYKYGTRVPKDYLKWARICEHIIRHYTEGWANGYHYDIEYWEIWNEFDCRNADGSNPCWQGTEEQFVDFYCTVATYLKEQFPNLKIGGPAFCSSWNERLNALFLGGVRERKAPLDFFSYHCYGKTPENVRETVEKAESELEKHGFGGTETILNEWNYVKGWLGEEHVYTMKVLKGLKGSAFIASTMCLCQPTPLYMLMYYDARPTGWNGMFCTDDFAPRKGYYPFPAWSDLAELGDYVPTAIEGEKLYAAAATNGKDSALLFTHYDDDDSAPAREVEVRVAGAVNGRPVKLSYYLLDEEYDMTLVREEIFTGEEFSVFLKATLFSTHLLKITQL